MRILAGFEILLIAVTWPLWWGNSSFPAIPLMHDFSLPIVADRIFLCILLTVCIFVAGATGDRPTDKVMRIAALAAALMLCVCNQHRIQAWHWLFICGVATSFFKPQEGLQLFRGLLASIYVCSAFSRMAPLAHVGMSAAIVDQLLWMFGIQPELLAGRVSEILCHGFNLGELGVGLLLLWPKSRHSGMLLAMLLHGTLLLALGPLGLRHHTAVFIWNLCFLCLLPVVFSGRIIAAPPLQTGQHWSYRVASCFVWLFPLSGLFGIADNWPAWQLYSTRPETWVLRVRESSTRDLDQSLQPHISGPAPLGDWVVVRLDRWSLAETESPLYPQARFQRELICRVLAKLPDNAEFSVDISEPQRWFWWKRIHRTLNTRAQMDVDFP
ncbi:MAG: hypothetical protein DWI22_16355 [Planctomycetota bacterium]|nr:MAG: hypothetical protein DWI22_16355 [Planctomycetota bacterium]